MGLPAKRVPLSGACAAIGLGDVNVMNGKALVDHKSTIGKESIGIKLADLEKIAKYAGEGLGILTFSYKYHRTVYAVIPLEELIELLKAKWNVV